MPVYMIIEVEVVDEKTYAEYIEMVPATVGKYDGRYLVRGGQVTPISGDWHTGRIILLEFPSAEQLQRWLASPEYQEIAPLRMRSTKSKAIMVEGYPAAY